VHHENFPFSHMNFPGEAPRVVTHKRGQSLPIISS